MIEGRTGDQVWELLLEGNTVVEVPLEFFGWYKPDRSVDDLTVSW